MSVGAFVILSLLLCGCAASRIAPVDDRVLTKDDASINVLNFQSMSVEDRFKKAMAAGDMRFLGIYGYALTVPGVPAAMLGDRSIRTVLPIAGTSDAFANKREKQLNDDAWQYAKSYNALVLEQKK